MEDLSDDEQLQLAIQMSLEEECAEPPSKRRRVSPPQHVQQHLVIEESEAPSDTTTSHRLTCKEASRSSVGAIASSESRSITGLLGIDRKAMEKERLAIAAKRFKTTPSAPDHSATQPQPALKFTQQDERGQTQSNDHSENPRMAILQPASHDLNSLQYPHGVIKRTRVLGQDRKNDISIDEILQKNELRKAALSSFQWDNEWLWNKLDSTRTNVMVIMQGKTDYDRQEITLDAGAFNPRIRLCFPPMPGQVNCMHSKLMLLFYDSFLRIVVPTANLVKHDWGDDGRVENCVFVIDLPEQIDESQISLEKVTAFGRALHYFLGQMEVPESLLRAVLRYDYAQTQHLAFVHTVGNDRQYGSARDQTGYPGLSAAIHQLDLRTDALQLDYVSSSIGMLKDDFLNAFSSAAKGESVASTPTLDYKNRSNGYKGNLTAYFPSKSTVVKSLGGPDAAGALCFQRRWWKDPAFPKAILRDCQSTRSGIFSHSKLLLGRGYRKDKTCHKGEKAIAWAYVGSHNLSESAWGRVTMDKARKETKINCKNWECGILMAVEVESEDKTDERGIPSMDVFRKHLEIPFEYPGQSYAGTEPWFFND